MKTLVLFGSPDKKGETAKLLEAFTEALPDEHRRGLEIFDAYGADISPCLGCKACRTAGKGLGKCVLKDDMTQLYSAIEQADVLVIATPIYFMSFPAPLKAVIDRLQPFWERQNTSGLGQSSHKKGVALVSLGDKLENNKGFAVILRAVFSMLGAPDYRAFYAQLSDLPEGGGLLEDCREQVRSFAPEIYGKGTNKSS